MGKRKILVSVIGGSECDKDTAYMAEEVGNIIGSSGAVLLSGGLGGVMEAASRGAKKSGGLVLGIIPGEEKSDANSFVDIVIPTGMGYSRNALVAGAADIVVAFPGKYGTLSEIGFALNAKKEVYGLETWEIPGIKKLGKLEDLKGIIKSWIDG